MGFSVEPPLLVSGTAMLVSGVLTFLGLSFFAAPYGKYSTAKGFGPQIPAQLAWSVMESPNLWISFVIWYYRSALGGDALSHPVNQVALLCFLLHYINRSIIYPLRMSKDHATPMPLSVMVAAFVFCSWNGANQALALIVVGNDALNHSNITDLRCIVGLGLFLTGFAINVYSDNILIRSKKRGESRVLAGKGSKYVIPRGGVFEYVSCANYCKSSRCTEHHIIYLECNSLMHICLCFLVGEIVEWWGFALICWTYVGFAFAVYTTAYLSSRAMHVSSPCPFTPLSTRLTFLLMRISITSGTRRSSMTTPQLEKPSFRLFCNLRITFPTCFSFLEHFISIVYPTRLNDCPKRLRVPPHTIPKPFLSSINSGRYSPCIWSLQCS
jgi:hypothetical protein